MSSLKMAGHRSDADEIVDDQWFVIESPADQDPIGDASPVLAAITNLRDRIRSGREVGVDVDENQLPEYGGGDRRLADDMAEDVATRWDR